MFAFLHCKTAISFNILLALQGFRYFVGTNEMLVGLHVLRNFQMYRPNPEQALFGVGEIAPTPPPPRGNTSATST